MLRFPFRDVDRAITERECAGLVKLVAHRGRLLGASVLGPRGGELLHELALAMTAGVRLGAIAGRVDRSAARAAAQRAAMQDAERRLKEGLATQGAKNRAARPAGPRGADDVAPSAGIPADAPPAPARSGAAVGPRN